MKKLIAISVMIALVAGVTFADPAINATVDARFKVSGNTADGDANDPKAHGYMSEAKMGVSGQNDEGNLGGQFTFRAHEANGALHTVQANVWWKPIDQLKIFMGVDGDGKFESGQLTSWAFHQGAEGFIVFHQWDFWRTVFPGNWDGHGIAVSLYPVEEAEINVAFDFGAQGWPSYQQSGGEKTVKETMGRVMATASYAIPDVGKIFLNYTGPHQAKGFDNDEGDKGLFGASFYLDGMVDGLQLQAGMSMQLADTDKWGDEKPLYMGLAAHYTGGEWGVKIRSAFVLKPENTKDGSLMVFEVMPWYDMGTMKICFDFGLSVANKEYFVATGGLKDESLTAWWINPYAKVPMGGGFFQFGFKMQSAVKGDSGLAAWDGGNGWFDDKLKWSLPMRLVFSF